MIQKETWVESAKRGKTQTNYKNAEMKKNKKNQSRGKVKLQTESVNDVKCWRKAGRRRYREVAKYTLPKVSTKARYILLRAALWEITRWARRITVTFPSNSSNPLFLSLIPFSALSSHSPSRVSHFRKAEDPSLMLAAIFPSAYLKSIDVSSRRDDDKFRDQRDNSQKMTEF